VSPPRDAATATLEQAATLPPELVLTVLRRYGRPVDLPLPLPLADDKVVTLEGATLRRVRLRLPIDVIANDWFVLEGAGEALAVAGPLFAAALATVARLLAERS
jgi:hypothetical protein